MRPRFLALAIGLTVAALTVSVEAQQFSRQRQRELQAEGYVPTGDGTGSYVKRIPFEASAFAFRESRQMGANSAAALPSRNPNPVPPIRVGDPRQESDAKPPAYADESVQSTQHVSRPAARIPGPPGPKGDRGDKGEKGDKGDPGRVTEEQLQYVAGVIYQRIQEDPALRPDIAAEVDAILAERPITLVAETGRKGPDGKPVRRVLGSAVLGGEIVLPPTTVTIGGKPVGAMSVGGRLSLDLPAKN